MAMTLDGKRALITGASGGIGEAIARAMHSRGATVVLTARRGEVLDELRAELGERAEVLPADLSDAAAVAALPGRAGAVDVLVANAGLQAGGELPSFTSEQIDRALDVNLRAPLQLTRALLPAMLERGSGHLVFISSLSGKAGSPGASLYSATKFGLRGFALGLREDLHASGVGVTTVFPGFIRDAGMFHDSGTELPRGVGTRSPEQVAAAVVRGIERGRLEIDVAPLFMRLGTKFAGLAPALAGDIQRRFGGSAISEQIARAHLDKR